MLTHPMFDRNDAHVPAAAAIAAGYDDALLNSRYATASAGATGMNPFLLQQEMRRQEMLTASGGYAAASAAVPPPPEKNATLLARREELVRLNDAHNRIMEAELAARAMRDRVAAAQVAQDRVAAAQNESFRADSIERIVALQEQEAARQRENEKLKQAEFSEQSGRAFGGVLHHHQAAAAQMPMAAAGGGVDRFFDTAALSADPMAAGTRNQIAEEMAFRGHMQRRMLEEEVIKQQAALNSQQATLNSQQAAWKSQQAMMDFAGARDVAAASAERERQHQQRQAALNNQHQAMMGMTGGLGAASATAASTERDNLTRLLQLQQVPDEDLLRRATEVQNARSAQSASLQSASLQHTLEQNKIEEQLFEAQLLRSDLQRYHGGAMGENDRGQRGLDLIDQVHADAAIARRFSGIVEAHVDVAAARRYSGIDQAHADAAIVARRFSSMGSEKPAGRQPISLQQASIPQDFNDKDKPQPLRYFNNGIEVDMDGNPLDTRSPVSLNINTSNHGNGNDNLNSPAPVQDNINDGTPSPAQAINNLASVDNNIIAKFLTVVVSRVPEISPSVADLLPDGGDPMLLKREFPTVVDATLAKLKSIQERFSSEGDNGSIDLYRRVTNCIAAIEPYKVDLSSVSGMSSLPPMAGGIMNQGVSDLSLDPDSVQPLMPNNPMKFPAVPPPAARHNPYLSPPGELLAARQASAFNANAENQLSPLGIKKESKAESPVSDNLPLMAVYKSEKKAAKKAKKKKKSKKNRPTLVHRASPVKEDFDLSVLKKAASFAQRQMSSGSPSSSSYKSSSSSSNDAIKSRSSSEASEKSRPMKKRRVSGQAKIDDTDDSIHPISGIYQKNGEVKNVRKSGPHGDLLDQLFGADSNKTPRVAGSTKKTKFKSSIGKAKKPNAKSHAPVSRLSADAESAVITDVSEHITDVSEHTTEKCPNENNEKDLDGHYDAASVLLGLMGK